MISRCDNTNCESAGLELLLEVELLDDFDRDRIYWCQDCIRRDNNMIFKIYSENE